MPASSLSRPISIVGGVVILSIIISVTFQMPAFHSVWIKPVNFFSELFSSDIPIRVTSLKKAKPAPSAYDQQDTLHLKKGFSTIENYYPDSNNRWQALCEKLIQLKLSKKGIVRIAWLGDSQIEGDIFTQDIRRLFQKEWGGIGVGFVPIATHVPGFRQSIDFSFSNEWQTYSLTDKKTRLSKIPWTLNGEIFIPEAEHKNTDSGVILPADSTQANPITSSSTAMVHYKTPSENFTQAMLVYGETSDSVPVYYSIDKHPQQKLVLPPSTLLNTCTIKPGVPFKTLDLIMPVSPTPLYYGASFNSTSGIILDNYSLRGAAGLHLMALTDESIRAYNSFFNYDLIVLQYGINVATTGVNDYAFYKQDMIHIVKRLHKLMPHTAILLIGLSDRSIKHNGMYETMPEVITLLQLQKEVAQTTGCVFWSAFDAMGGQGSMANWVDAHPPLANKDYTHFKPEGGKVLACYFNYAWMYEVNKYIWIKKHRRA